MFFSCVDTKIKLKPNEKNVDFLIEKGKVLWEQRTNKGALKKAEHFISRASEERPRDFELSVLLSRIKHTNANYFEKDPFIKKQALLEGARIAKLAVLKHTKFESLFEDVIGDTSFKLISSIPNAPKELVPGLFWWAVNKAQYLNDQPVLERLNQRELLEVIMHRVLSLDPGFNYSGPYRFFGSLYSKIPGVELSQAQTYFEQAIKSNPEYLLNSVFMAEYYLQKKGDREQFNKILNNVINTDLNQYPTLMNENYFSKVHAQALLNKESSLFE